MTPTRYTIHDAIRSLQPGIRAILIELHLPLGDQPAKHRGQSKDCAECKADCDQCAENKPVTMTCLCVGDHHYPAQASRGIGISTTRTEGIIQNVHKAGINFVPGNSKFTHGKLKGIPDTYVFLPDDKETNGIFFLEVT